MRKFLSIPKSMLILLAFTLCLISVNSIVLRSASAGTDVAVEKDIREAERQWFDAFSRHDATAFSRFITDDYCSINDDGDFSNRAQVLTNVASPNSVSGTFTRDEPLVRVYGDSAVVTGRGFAKGTIRGMEFIGYVRYTEVWVKRDGRWLAASWQGTRVK